MSINDVFPHCITEIKNLRLTNVNKFIISNLNINSLPSKFDQLREIVLKYVDVLVVTETKLDDTFLTSQFSVTGFSVPYRLDPNRNGGGIIIFIRDYIPSRVLTKHVFPEDIERLFIELNFRKSKRLLLEHITHQMKYVSSVSFVNITHLGLNSLRYFASKM